MDDFSVLLYDKLRVSKGVTPTNLVCSPLSIRVVLKMLAAGAEGSTLQAFGDAMLSSYPQDFSPDNMTISNAVFMEDWVKLKPNYRLRLVEEFRAKLSQIAPDKSPALLCKEINDWVNERTKGMIKAIVSPDDVGGATLAFLNAVWFKDKWREAFDTSLTRENTFWVRPNERIEVPFMNQKMYLHYGDFGIAQMVKIPYVGPFSMFVILPKDFEATQDALASHRLNDWIKQLQGCQVSLSMPKFSLTTGFDLGETLKRLGLGIIFDQHKADFHGMCSVEDVPYLWVDRVLHKARIDVDEEGTEAAAVTMAGVSGYSGGGDYKTAIFRVNRPFMFVIQHDKTPTTLFMGQIVYPTQG